jgi:signal peptidase II
MQAARGTPLTSEASADQPTSGRPRIAALLLVAVTVLALDVASKALVVEVMSDRAPIRVLGDLLEVTYARNPGAAFSFGQGMTVVFTAVAVVVIVAILRLAPRLRSLGWAIALGGLLGGALGNLSDRLFRSPGVLRGNVVDWIHVAHWPIFNLADSAIVTSAVMIAILVFRGIHPDGTRS